MAESVAAPQTQSLSEEYHLEKEVKQDTSAAKPVEVAPEVTTTQAEEVSTEKESPVVEEAVSAVEDKSEAPPATSEEVASEEAPPAAVEVVEDNADETPPAAVEEINASEEIAEETPDEIKLETAPADFRFPTTNQTRHCFTRYIEYHRCVAAKGDDAPECDKFSKFYRSLCPGEWVDKWNEQRENGTFPGPL